MSYYETYLGDFHNDSFEDLQIFSQIINDYAELNGIKFWCQNEPYYSIENNFAIPVHIDVDNSVNYDADDFWKCRDYMEKLFKYFFGD